MTITQQDIDAIDRAIASGEQEVRYADRSVKKRSVDELIKAKSALIAEMASTGRPRVIRLYHAGKGC